MPHDDPAELAPVATSPAADAFLPDGPLWARVAALPPRQREAVVLKYVGDLDHPTIAATLGTTPAMSRRLVSDALATLRKDLP
jgi:DNA-directed RNA polymerase specialized sigma24 family protein